MERLISIIVCFNATFHWTCTEIIKTSLSSRYVVYLRALNLLHRSRKGELILIISVARKENFIYN